MNEGRSVRRPRADAPVATERKRRSALALVVVVILAAACGATASTIGSRRPRAPTGPSYEVTTGAVNGLGTVLVDGDGYSLYLFIPDDQSGRSVCTDVCAVQWPPLILPKGISEPLAGRGTKPSLIGTTTRADGSMQVTYNGWPLYLWPNDTSPGQATGQGLNNLGGLWYVVSPQGNPIRS